MDPRFRLHARCGVHRKLPACASRLQRRPGSRAPGRIEHRADIKDGRWLIDVRHKQASWEVIVEPDPKSQLLVVVTAYPVEEQKS